MKIVFALDGLGGGGFERRMSQLILGLWKQRQDIQVIVIMPRNSVIVHDEILNNKQNIVYFDGLLSFQKLIKSYRPDIVHSGSPHLSVWLCLCKIQQGFKLIDGYVADANKHPLFSKHQLGYWASFPFADAIISNSKAGLVAYRCPMKKSYVIKNGFENSRLDIAMDTELESKCKQYDFVINMAAVMRSHKDFVSFINLAEKLKKTNILFLISGGGPEEVSIKEYADSKKLSNLLFLGYRKDIINVFKLSDISILFSKVGKHKEGISNSIMESMAVGTPVIATNNGGSVEIIQNNYDGWLVDDNNIDRCVSIIKKMMSEHDTLEFISSNAQKKISEDYSLERMVDEYSKLYARIV